MRGGRLLVVIISMAIASCGGRDETPTTSSGPSRTYLMGFSAIPPRLDPALFPRTVDLWAQRADAGIVLQEPPWADPLAGRDPEALVRANPLGIADYFRGKGLRIIGGIDPTNGLDRRSESGALVAAGHSLGEPAVRQL